MSFVRIRQRQFHRWQNPFIIIRIAEKKTLEKCLEEEEEEELKPRLLTNLYSYRRKTNSPTLTAESIVQ
jgi:hypothetical protein